MLTFTAPISFKILIAEDLNSLNFKSGIILYKLGTARIKIYCKIENSELKIEKTMMNIEAKRLAVMLKTPMQVMLTNESKELSAKIEKITEGKNNHPSAL
jgi:hypothetical protein